MYRAPLVPVLTALLLGLSGAVAASEAPTGAQEYAARCAVCHGVDGRGEGPYAMFLRTAPTDLTRLARGNGGGFPFDRVMEVIDGRREVIAHGPREMPVWGLEYNDAARAYYDRILGTDRAEQHIRMRILGLARHLEAIQRD